MLSKRRRHARTGVSDALSPSVIEPHARADDVSLPRQVYLRRITPHQNRIRGVRGELSRGRDGPVFRQEILRQIKIRRLRLRQSRVDTAATSRARLDARGGWKHARGRGDVPGMDAVAEGDAVEKVIRDVGEGLPDVLPDVERISDAAKLIVDVDLGAVAQAIVRGEDLRRLTVVELEALGRHGGVDDAHAASCEDGEEREALHKRLKTETHLARVGDPDGERAAAVMPILIRGASSDGEDGLGVDAGARDAPPEARRRTPWVAERENALVLNDHLDREAETRAPVKTRDGVRAREPLAKLERDGARHDVVDDGTKRVGLRRNELALESETLHEFEVSRATNRVWVWNNNFVDDVEVTIQSFLSSSRFRWNYLCDVRE